MAGCSGNENQDQQEVRIAEVLGNIKQKLLVMSGKGGVGKSTLAVNIASTISNKGYKVGLLDVDLHGPSVAGIMGLRGLPLNTIGNYLEPYLVDENLKVMTIQGLLNEPDGAVIWRGPAKIGVIRQLISDVNWGPLDFLIIDSPPGTGDEPLTVAQTIPGCKAVVVTTPQEVAIADVKKSLNFCYQAGLEVVGIVENMSGFRCPSCGNIHDIFKTGGGEILAREWNMAFLGKIPIDGAVVEAADQGKEFVDNNSFTKQSMNAVVENILNELASKEKEAAKTLRVGIPMAGGKLCSHFGHCEEFAIVNVEEGRITGSEKLVPPPHEPGVIPNWLASQKVNLVLAGGMGVKAQAIFEQKGINVICGVPADSPETIVLKYLAGNLQTGVNACSHGEEDDEHHCHH